MLASLGLSLALTLFLELGTALILGLHKGKDLLLVALVNVFTNPVVVLVLGLTMRYTHTDPPWYLVAILEGAAVLTEGFLYRSRLEYRKIHPLLFSIILNAISYFGGLLL